MMTKKEKQKYLDDARKHNYDTQNTLNDALRNSINETEKTAMKNTTEEAREFFDGDNQRAWLGFSAIQDDTLYIDRDNLARLLFNYAAQFQPKEVTDEEIEKYIYNELPEHLDVGPETTYRRKACRGFMRQSMIWMRDKMMNK